MNIKNLKLAIKKKSHYSIIEGIKNNNGEYEPNSKLGLKQAFEALIKNMQNRGWILK